jgi:hypothetical protein
MVKCILEMGNAGLHMFKHFFFKSQGFKYLYYVGECYKYSGWGLEFEVFLNLLNPKTLFSSKSLINLLFHHTLWEKLVKNP